MSYQRIIVDEGQTLLDVALQEYGDAAQGLFYLVADNLGLAISSDLSAGDVLNIRVEALEVDSQLRSYLKQINFTVCSGEVAAGSGGIGEMEIGSTFIVA